MAKIKKVSDVAVYGRLLKYVVPRLHWFAFSVLGYMAYSGAQVLSADLLQFVVDSLGGQTPKAAGIMSTVALAVLDYTGHNTNKLIFAAIGVSFVVVALVRGIGFFFGSFYLSKVSLHLVHQLRCEVFTQMLSLPASRYEQTSTGELLTKVTYHVNQVADAATNALKILLQEGLVVIGILAYMLLINWKLTCLFLSIMPIIGFIGFWIGKQFRRISRHIQNSIGSFTQVANEAIGGYREVRLFGGQDYENRRFAERSGDNLHQSIKLQFYSSLGSPVIIFILSLALAVLIYLALLVSEQGTPGQFVAFLTAAAIITRPVRQLTQVLAVIQRGLAACDDIFAFIDAKNEVDGGVYSTDAVAGKIEFKDVYFAYDDDAGDVLQGISFDVQAGQTLALVGYSGSGKSTIANLICRFYNCERGQILLDGEPLNNYKLANLREHIGLVSQHVTLFDDSVYNNIAYGDLAYKTRPQVMAAAVAANAKEFIDELPYGIDTIIGEDGASLSGGQRQRVAIARAILKNAPILILDEATSALDNRSESLIQRALDQITANRTCIVIAHRLSTIEKADKILVLDEGRIVEQGTHAELLAQSKRYKQLYENRFED